MDFQRRRAVLVAACRIAWSAYIAATQAVEDLYDRPQEERIQVWDTDLNRDKFLATLDPTDRVNDEQCSVCQDGDGEKRRVPCGHIFDLECITNWSQGESKRTCQLCRRKYLLVRMPNFDDLEGWERSHGGQDGDQYGLEFEDSSSWSSASQDSAGQDAEDDDMEMWILPEMTKILTLCPLPMRMGSSGLAMTSSNDDDQGESHPKPSERLQQKAHAVYYLISFERYLSK